MDLQVILDGFEFDSFQDQLNEQAFIKKPKKVKTGKKSKPVVKINKREVEFNPILSMVLHF